MMISYCLIGVPLAYYFAFIKHDGTTNREEYGDKMFSTCGNSGLLAGLIVATAVNCFPMKFFMLCFLNWEEVEPWGNKRMFVSTRSSMISELSDYDGEEESIMDNWTEEILPTSRIRLLRTSQRSFFGSELSGTIYKNIEEVEEEEKCTSYCGNDFYVEALRNIVCVFACASLR
mmetsp:Transcript_25172/g.38944  ORF Transcript_25172/g.38944 Transcript_25172/m.38944 type:complete len:174 (-) Transcript_25172:39-560(-)